MTLQGLQPHLFKHVLSLELWKKFWITISEKFFEKK